MNKEQLEHIKFCPYCFQDEGAINRVFEVAFQNWEYYDAELKEYKPNLSHSGDDVIVFCVECENEILEKDIRK